MSAPDESLPTYHSLPLPTEAILCIAAAETQAPHRVVTSVVISASTSTIRPGGGAGCSGNFAFFLASSAAFSAASASYHIKTPQRGMRLRG
jgi:hypothetical protein